MSTMRPPELILLRYGELALKGKNRHMFEEALQRNVHSALKEIAPARIERRRARMAVLLDERVEEAAQRLQSVFGLSSLSPAWGCEPQLEPILELARDVLADALAPLPPGARPKFRVRSSRGDKRFPLTSPQLDRAVAERVLPEFDGRLTIDLNNAELELEVDVREERAYVFARRLAGAGGLPVGTLGRGLCLLSGGIDSPVAAWLSMKRGLRVSYLSFLSPPYLGEGTKRKLVRLVRGLAPWQPHNRLYLVPFTEIQMAIRDGAPEPYRTVLYRRAMQKIGARVARREKAGCLITGESLGQVASQTLENLTCIGAASELPVLRPLITNDKQETIALAQRIGTYEISTLPEPDCCTVFMPSKPIIRGRIEECLAAEESIGLEALIRAVLPVTERIVLED